MGGAVETDWSRSVPYSIEAEIALTRSEPRSPEANPAAHMMQAVNACIGRYFHALHKCDGRAFDTMWHPSGMLLGVGPDGKLVARDAAAFRLNMTTRTLSDTAVFTSHDRIDTVSFVAPAVAVVKVRVHG